MNAFNDLNIKKQLQNAIADLGFQQTTPIQQESFSPIVGGADFVGIAQTGTGKTIAYLLPILHDLKFSNQLHPRVLILAPTRELVIQIVEQIELLTAYMTVRVLGVYGGSNNIKAQKRAVAEGQDIIVGTPRRLYDLALSQQLRLKQVKKLVIDEVDIMLDFGYKTQLQNIFELLPEKRQNILFSATMTNYVDRLSNDFLTSPVKRTISVSGTPLDTISQECYSAANFYTKANLLEYLLTDKETHHKVLIFVATKVSADRLFSILGPSAGATLIHAGKEQNYRTKSIEQFESGASRILIATDVIARGIDIEKISTVISFDTPFFPENYIHRIGRTGRAQQKGRAILFFNEKETPLKEAIEGLMNYKIPQNDFPEVVEVSTQLTEEERTNPVDEDEAYDTNLSKREDVTFHEKKAKNSKEKVERKSYSKVLKERYKKPLKRGDKIQNRKKKKK